MFSGIVERLAPVTGSDRIDGALALEIGTGFADLELGESIAVNGVCLTVTSRQPTGEARFFASPETLQRTSLGRLQAGDAVNIERAVNLATRLSGHLVQGHVDGLARLAARQEVDGAWNHEFVLPPELDRYTVEKGSIALDGISLTLNAVRPGPQGVAVAVTIIPHTWTHTNLHRLSIGDFLNVEVDVMAKYVERLCKPYL